MNKTFKTVWNHFRRSLVVVDEKSASRGKSRGASGTGSVVTAKTKGAKRPAVSLIAATVALTFGAAPAFAAVDTTAWTSETGVVTKNVSTVTPSAGGAVGLIDYWSGSWDNYASKTLINILAGGGYDLGVFGSVYDEFWDEAANFGELGSTGLFREYAVINAGSMIEQAKWTSYADPENPTQEDQVGGVYWIEKFANNGTVQINDLRSRIVANTTANFRVNTLTVRSGGVLDNSGTMNVAGALNVGVTKDSIFDSNSSAVVNQAGTAYDPPAIESTDFDANNTASVANSGTLNAASVRIAGTLDNTGTVSVTNTLQVGGKTDNASGKSITAGTFNLGAVDNKGSMTGTGTAAHTFGATENSGSINLDEADGTFASLNQTASTATLDTTGDVTVTGALTNAGKIGNTGKPSSLSVGGDTQNQATGLIKAVAGAFATVTNYGSIIIDNLLSATGLIDNKADASISAGTLNTKGITNAGSLATTGSGNSTIDGNLTNTKTVTLGSGTTTVTGNVSNSVAAATIDSTGALTISGTLDNSGKIGNTNAPTTLSVTGKTTNAANALVKAGAATLGAVENHGTVAVTGALSAGATTNSGTMTAASADLSSTLGNTGDITITNAITVAGATTNSKNITAKSGTFADVANASPGVISLTNDSTMASISANSGHIEVSSGKLTVTNGAVQTDGEIVADSAQMGSLTNQGENGSSVEVAKTLTVTGATDNKAKSTIEAGNLVLAGTTNAGTITSTAATGTNTFGATENSGAIDLASSGTFASLNQTAAAATLDTTGTVGVTGTLTNKGKIGNTKTPSSLAVGGAVDNQAGGIIKTGSADFDSTLANAGTITATGAMSVDGKTTNASTGAITAATLTLGETENAGSITGTGTAAHTFGATENTGSIDLGTAQGTFASLDQSAATGTLDTTGVVAVTGTLTNKGKIGQTKTPSNLTAGGAVDNQAGASIQAGAASFASTLGNAGSVAITNGLGVTGKTTNSGTITAATLTLGEVENAGSITGNGASDHSFGATTNTGSIGLGAAKGTFASLSQTDANATLDTTGAVEITGALTNQGKIGETGKPSAISVGGTTNNSGSIKAGAGTFAALTNSGSIAIDGALGASGALANTGTIMAATATFGGAGSSNSGAGASISAGTVNVNNTFTNSAALTASTGTNVGADGVLTLANGGNANLGNLAITGRVDNQAANTQIATLSGAGVLSNSVALTNVAHIGTTTGMTYNQTAGTISAADNSWFAGSTLNISGGTITRTAAGANTLGTGNTVTISGTPIAFTDKAEAPAGWRNGTYVHVGVLDSASSVTINTGGVLEADSINLTSNSLTINGGALASTLSNLFAAVSETLYEIPDGAATTIDTNIIGAATVNSLNLNLLNNLTFGDEGATFVITDPYISMTAVTAASDALANAAGAGKETAVVYTGTLSESGSEDRNFYYETFTSLLAEQGEIAASKFNAPGVVFSNMTYVNALNREQEALDNFRDKLVVGAAGEDANTFYLTKSIGFKAISGTDDVTVSDGRTLVLTGGHSASELVNSANGAVAVTGEGSKLKLGSAGVNNTVGHVGTVSLLETGALTVDNGAYTLTSLVATNGATTVNAGSSLTVTTLTDAAGSTIANSGTLLLQTADELNSAVTNNSSFEVRSDTAVNALFTNAAGTATFANAQANAGIANAEGAKLVFSDGLTVSTALTGTGTKLVDSNGRLVSHGLVDVQGSMRTGANSSTMIQGTLNVASGAGRLNMRGDAYASAMNVEGTAQVSAGKTLIVDGNLGIDVAGRLMLRANADGTNGAKVVAKTLSSLGTISKSNGVSVSVGDLALSANSAKISELKGDDYQQPMGLFSFRPRLLMSRLNTAPTGDLNGRVYDLDKTDGFASNMPSGDITADTQYSGIAANKTYRLPTSTLKNGATLSSTDNAHVLEGDTFRTEQGTHVNFFDTTLNSEQRYSNLIVKGVVEFGGEADNAAIIVGGNGQYNVTATGESRGQFLTMTGDATSTIAAGGVSSFEKTDIDEDATMTNNGSLNGAVVNVLGTLGGTGVIANADGEVTVEAGASLTQTSVAVKTLTNKGATTLETVANFGANNTFVTSGDAAQLAINDGNWFSGTNLTFEGGAQVASADLNADGELGANTVVIRGDADPVITQGEPNTATFDGMTTVRVAKLKAESVVDVQQGGRLIVDALDANGVNTTLSGGVIDLSISDLLTDSANIEGVLLDAASAADTAEIDSAIVANEDGVVFKDSALNGLTLTSGTVSVVSPNAVKLSVLNMIASNLGTTVTTVYNGALAAGVSSDQLSIETVASLLAEQAGMAGSAVTNPGVVLTQYDLTGDATTAPAVIAFGEQGDINGSIGFRSVKNALGISIDDGLEVALTGTAKTSDTIDFEDADKQLTGTVSVAEGKFTFGSDGTSENSGWVESVDSDGEVVAKNGLWGVKGDLTGAGDITVNENAELVVGGLVLDDADAASLTVDGVLSLNGEGGDVVIGSGRTVAIGEFGEFDAGSRNVVSSAQTTVEGTANYVNLTLNDGATNTVAASGSESGKTLEIKSGAEQVVEQGAVSSWETVKVAGRADVGASVDWESTTVEAGGEMAVSGGYGLAEGQSLTIAGTFDATALDELVAAGVIQTAEGGVAGYKALTLNDGASNTVKAGGSESGTTLSVKTGATQTVEQGALSEWAEVTVEGTAIVAEAVDWTQTSVADGGEMTVSGGYAVAEGQTVENAGTFDATTIGDLSVEGDVATADGGVTKFANVALAGTNTVKAGGSEQGGVLTVESGATQTVEQNASSSWDKVVIAGNADVAANVDWTETEIAPDGALTASGEFAVDDGESVVNGGTFDATGVANLAVAGDVTTADGGVSSYANMTLTGSNTVEHGGAESGKTLTVAEGGMQVVEEGGESHWKNLALNGGSVLVFGGTMTADASTLDSGDLVIGDGVFATNGADADAARAASDRSAVLAVGGTLETGNAIVRVGNTEGINAAAGDVVFGSDSALYIDTANLSGAALKGNGSGSLTVAAGSQLVVANATWGKHYLVADEYSTDGVEDGAWSGENMKNLTGENAFLTKTSKSIVLNVGNEEEETTIEALDSRYIAPSVINALIDDETNIGLRDANSKFADVAFIERMLDKTYVGEKDGKLDKDKSVRFVNSVMGLAAASGADAYAVDQAFGLMDRVDSHLTGVKFAKNAQAEGALWVDVIGEKSKTTSLDFGAGKAGYKASSTGIVLGADVARSDVGTAGIAFRYADGDIKSRGDSLSTKTDAKSYGFALYASRDFGKARVSAQAGYDVTKGDVSQSFADIRGNGYSVKADTKAKTVSLGIKGEYAFDAGSFEIVPHAAVRVAHTSYSGADISINGQKAFRTKSASTDIVQMPLGVAVKGKVETASGWTVKPFADVSVVPQMGDKDTKATVSAANYNGTGSYTYDVAGSFVGKLDLGISATKGAHSLGVVYSGAKGNSGKESHGLTAKYKFTF